MKVELYALHVGYGVFYFSSSIGAGIAAAAMASAMESDGAASPERPSVKVTLAQASPRVERVVLDVPRRVLRDRHASSPIEHLIAAAKVGAA